MVEVNKEYEGMADDEFVEVEGSSDFPPTLDWDDYPEGFVGTFVGTVTKEIKGKDRVIHTFDIDGTETQVWGAAILDSRLKEVPAGARTKVVKTGRKLNTNSGHKANEFRVLVARSALAGR